MFMRMFSTVLLSFLLIMFPLISSATPIEGEPPLPGEYERWSSTTLSCKEETIKLVYFYEHSLSSVTEIWVKDTRIIFITVKTVTNDDGISAENLTYMLYGGSWEVFDTIAEENFIDMRILEIARIILSKDLPPEHKLTIKEAGGLITQCIDEVID